MTEQGSTHPSDEQPVRPSMARAWPAVAMVLVLAGVAAATFLGPNRSPASRQRTIAPVIFPTKMVSPTVGWAVTAVSSSPGSSDEVWRTTNGATSWVNVTPAEALSPYGYRFAQFSDETHAWITELAGDGKSTPSLVTFRTTDGGQTWQRGAPLSATYETQVAEYFLDADSGWLVLASDPLNHAAWPTVYVTSDGGLHWSLEASQAGAGTASGDLFPGPADVRFVSADRGWLTVSLSTRSGNAAYFSRTALLTTEDGGRTWRTQPLPVEPPADAIIDAPEFFDQQHGVMVMHAITPESSVKPMLLSTADGGVTWTDRPLELPYIESIQFVDRKHGWAVAGPSSDFLKSTGGLIIPMPLWRTDDGGLTWARMATDLNLQKGRDRVTNIDFVDQQTGFATTWNDTGPTELLRSDDGGYGWIEVTRCWTALGNSVPPPPCPAST